MVVKMRALKWKDLVQNHVEMIRGLKVSGFMFPNQKNLIKVYRQWDLVEGTGILAWFRQSFSVPKFITAFTWNWTESYDHYRGSYQGNSLAWL